MNSCAAVDKPLMYIMKNYMAICFLAVMAANGAFAERYVVITHTQGTDPFWPVVEKGAKDAAASVGADIEYFFPPSGEIADMRQLIEAATASRPDGLIVSLPDPVALGDAIRAAVARGIPVITINSGFEASGSVGALMHVGQPEGLAGEKAGTRAALEGATRGLCLNHEVFNIAVRARCEGYFSGLGQSVNMIAVPNEEQQIRAHTAAALRADPALDAILAPGPHVCEAAAQAIADVGRDVHLACFDLTPVIIDLIHAGDVRFTMDQQQRLQGYLPIIVLHLFNANAGLISSADIPSGPGFVDASNADGIALQAGVNR